MQTRFTADQLADSDVRESEKILRTCVHCGFCTATCPTYLLLGDELDSPRGRIYLIKDMLESGRAATPAVVRHVDRCLSCLSCMTTCPSGVHYMHLVDHARAHIESTYRRPFGERAVRDLLAFVLPYPARFRAALWAARLARPMRGALRRIPSLGPPLAAMLDLAPTRLPKAASRSDPVPALRRVALLSGCAQPVLDPAINAATTRLLTRLGTAVVLPQGEGCCGALVHHMGRSQAAHRFASRNIDAWSRELSAGGLDAIIITTSGCGTTVKDYGYMFRDDPDYAEKAKQMSSLALDLSEYLVRLSTTNALGQLEPLAPSPQARGLVVAYHSACSMQHGQKLIDGPKSLLRAAGFAVKDVPEGHICCGSAGTYNILQPKIASQLRERKIANILRTRPQVIATGNLGCMTQIGHGLRLAGLDLPIVHTAQLLDWAYGGPLPEQMRGLVSADPGGGSQEVRGEVNGAEEIGGNTQSRQATHR
jgi:glycolate oxidase iron-sulfur subunit